MKWWALAAVALVPAAAFGQITAVQCESCEQWNVRQAPFRVFGNTYYVGTRELSAVLIASDEGLILIDGALPQSVPQIADHIRALGHDPRDIKFILNSHAHFDHAGGLAQLQRLSGAKVLASPWSAEALRKGAPAADDPQHGVAAPGMEPIKEVEVLRDGQVVRLGNLALTAHFTAGHTPGGTSWSWMSCEQARCLNLVYADSLTAVSADDYRYTDHPDLLRRFRESFEKLEALPCDILLSAHPGFSGTLQKLEAREQRGQADAFVDANSCRKYTATARTGLERRMAREGQ